MIADGCLRDDNNNVLEDPGRSHQQWYCEQEEYRPNDYQHQCRPDDPQEGDCDLLWKRIDVVLLEVLFVVDMMRKPEFQDGQHDDATVCSEREALWCLVRLSLPMRCWR